MATAVYSLMTAGRKADEMIHGHRRPHHNKTEEMGRQGPQYVTKEQFELYDTLKALAAIMFVMHAIIMSIGKCGKWMVWMNRSQAT